MTDAEPTKDERDARRERAMRAARAEAEARRKASGEDGRPREIDGRGGEEPTRYGDWEVKGLASDF